MPKRYLPEFRRTVRDLVAAGRPVAQIAADLGISDQTIYGWRKQELIDTEQPPGLNRAELAEPAAAKKRVRQLETEVAVLKRGTMAAEGLPVQLACRLLSVADSGDYEWRCRPPSARAVRHAWLTEQIRAVHAASRGTYGVRRVQQTLRCFQESVVAGQFVDHLPLRHGRQIRVRPGVVAELDLPGVDQRSQHPQVLGPRAVSSIDEEHQPNAGVFGELGVQADHLGVDAVINDSSRQSTKFLPPSQKTPVSSHRSFEPSSTKVPRSPGGCAFEGS